MLSRWRNYFSQLLNLHEVNYVRQAEIQTAKPPAPKPGTFVVQMATEKLKIHKSPGTDQTVAELIKAGGRTIHSKIHKLINSILNREEMPEQWKESNMVPIYKMGNKRYCSNYQGISLLSTTYNILSNTLSSTLTPYAEEITGAYQCGF